MKNYWYPALLISLLLHLLLFININLPLNKVKKKLNKDKNNQEIRILPQKIEKIRNEEITANAIAPKPAPYLENIADKLIENSKMSSLEKLKTLERNTKEVIFAEILPESKELKNNPAYMNYYRFIREKIKKTTYNNYNRNAGGEVIVSFKVMRDGTLANIDLNPNSVANNYLKTITVKSLKESAPFPAFPAELDEHPYLQFNISIYFKNN
jgi:outer membrane biosynthesis protein TonB